MEDARIGLALVLSPDGRFFGIGGADDNLKTKSCVEMLDCPWDGEGDVGRTWMLVTPMNRKGLSHRACYFEDDTFAVEEYGDASVECFVMPSLDVPKEQWIMVRPMMQVFLHSVEVFKLSVSSNSINVCVC